LWLKQQACQTAKKKIFPLNPLCNKEKQLFLKTEPALKKYKFLYFLPSFWSQTKLYKEISALDVDQFFVPLFNPIIAAKCSGKRLFHHVWRTKVQIF